MTREIIETHDLSALDAITNSRIAHSRAKILIAAGVGGLMFGLGGAALLWGYSLVREPKIVEKEKIVVTEKIVTVDKPVVTEKVVTIDRPVVTEKIQRVEVPTAAPPPPPQPSQPVSVTPSYTPEAPIPPPTVGAPMAPKEMEARPDYQAAETRGRITGINHGNISLDTGRPLQQLDNSLNLMDWTTSELNGLPTYCRNTGQVNPRNNIPLMNCYVTYRGKVRLLESIASRDVAKAAADFDPLGDLFN
jgi:hypothetical protein